MTSLRDRPNTALLVVDVQNDVVANAHRPRRGDREHQHAWSTSARAEQVPGDLGAALRRRPAEDSDGWQYVPELQREESEPLVHKRYGDSFEDTTLESELARRGVGRLVVAGAQTDACIRATIHGAFTRGYDTVLVGDAHTTEDFTEYGLPPADKVIAHTNMYWTLAGRPRGARPAWSTPPTSSGVGEQRATV